MSISIKKNSKTQVYIYDLKNVQLLYEVYFEPIYVCNCDCF